MAKKQETVPFKKIKKEGFFRMKGEKRLMQKGKEGYDDIGQVVTGKYIGHVEFFDGYGMYNLDTLVTPVNAKIVEEK